MDKRRSIQLAIFLILIFNCESKNSSIEPSTLITNNSENPNNVTNDNDDVSGNIKRQNEQTVLPVPLIILLTTNSDDDSSNNEVLNTNDKVDENIIDGNDNDSVIIRNDHPIVLPPIINNSDNNNSVASNGIDGIKDMVNGIINGSDMDVFKSMLEALSPDEIEHLSVIIELVIRILMSIVHF